PLRRAPLGSGLSRRGVCFHQSLDVDRPLRRRRPPDRQFQRAELRRGGSKAATASGRPMGASRLMPRSRRRASTRRAIPRPTPSPAALGLLSPPPAPPTARTTSLPPSTPLLPPPPTPPFP